MASLSMAMPVAAAAPKNRQLPQASGAFLKPLRVKESKQVKVGSSKPKLRVEASMKQKAVAAATTAAVAASMVVPEVAQAVEGLTPSLKNFLLSIVAGGVVLLVIAGAVFAVANFDPVKRN